MNVVGDGDGDGVDPIRVDPIPLRLGLLVPLTLALLGACACHSPGVTLPAGSRVLARGSLAYAVGFAGDGRVVSIELEERFALIVRTGDGLALGRFDLGPAERDLGALAMTRDVAWVGGADRRIRGLALADGRPIASWPTGATVTALVVVPGDQLVAADADGGLCLRRLADGALLQCVQLAARPITELAWTGELVVATAGDQRWALTVPALALAPAPALPRRVAIRGRALRIDGGPRVVLGGAVRAVAFDGHGRAAIAAWIADLDQPSLVLVPAR